MPHGGGGGLLPLEFVPDAQESPSKKHPKRGFNGMPKDTLNRLHGPIFTSYMRMIVMLTYQKRPY